MTCALWALGAFMFCLFAFVWWIGGSGGPVNGA